MKLLQPQPLPFDFDHWKKQPFAERLRMLCAAWAVQGYGAPVAVYSFYLLKILLYVGLWLVFCSFSHSLGSPAEIGSWWYEPEALLKAILWSMLFEGMGLASGSGPLTARYFPPIGGILYFARPGTLKLPLFKKLPLLGGEQRSWLDVLLYLAHLGFLLRALLAPEVTPALLWPTVVLLPLLGLMDRTIFLAARAEHYYIAMLCFLFPSEALAANKWVWWAIWFWAAFSKLNHHFPSVIGVMVSNSAVLRFPWLRKKLYKHYPDDLRPGTLATLMAHFGTLVEFTFPLLLIAGDGGTLTTVGLTIMLLFHLFITSNVPMAVPIEWNVMMVYGAFVLFGQHAALPLTAVHSPLLVALLVLALLVLPLLGNLFPRWISFLLSMRYYAGNWAYSIWLFRQGTEEKLDEHLTLSSPTLMRQLAKFYDPATAEALLSKVIGFRAMHLHGRALQQLLPLAVDDIDAYTWRDGELVAGVVLGWNFGDGHLHSEALLKAVQRRCGFAPGELRCIFVESQPLGNPFLSWRIADAAEGQLHAGHIRVKDLLHLQPWPQSQRIRA